MSQISKILHVPRQGHHFCQLHRTRQALDTALFVYVMTGIRKGEAVVVFSNASRLDRVRDHLAASGLDASILESSGQLSLHDGSTALETFLSSDKTDWAGFRNAIQYALEPVDAAGWPAIRVYGDMTNELWQAGRTAETVQLEKLWNAIMRGHDFPLFCGYEFDSLDPGACRNPASRIGHVHDEVVATDDDDFTVYALDRACAEVVGFSLSAITQHTLPASKYEPSLPVLHQIVLWLERNLSMHTAEVLKRARKHYADAGMKPIFNLLAGRSF